MTTDAEIKQLLADLDTGAHFTTMGRIAFDSMTMLVTRLLIEREKWKALAEFKHGILHYAYDVGIARGSLDAYFRNVWDNGRYLAFLEQAQQAADREKRKAKRDAGEQV